MSTKAAAPTRGQGEAPGKAILLGEHFVVHGSPALALPLTGLRLRAGLRPACPGEPRAAGHLGACLEIVLGALGQDPAALAVEVDSTIPLGSGMGSSAALSVALSRAGAEAFGLPPDPGRDRELSMRCERLAHGRPSGIDTEVCLTGRAVWAEGGRFTPLTTYAGHGIGLVVLLVGQGGATGEMVSRVGEFRAANPARFQALSEATRERCLEARALLEGGAMSGTGPGTGLGTGPGTGVDASERLERLGRLGRLERLGAILGEQHRALAEIGVSTPGLDSAVAAACEEGAAGAKLSGAGGGGAVLAIASLEELPGLAERLAARGLGVVTSGPLM